MGRQPALSPVCALRAGVVDGDVPAGARAVVGGALEDEVVRGDGVADADGEVTLGGPGQQLAAGVELSPFRDVCGGGVGWVGGVVRDNFAWRWLRARAAMGTGAKSPYGQFNAVGSLGPGCDCGHRGAAPAPAGRRAPVTPGRQRRPTPAAHLRRPRPPPGRPRTSRTGLNAPSRTPAAGSRIPAGPPAGTKRLGGRLDAVRTRVVRWNVRNPELNTVSPFFARPFSLATRRVPNYCPGESREGRGQGPNTHGFDVRRA